MKADLIKAASEVITNQQILVNMVSRRVRQLSLGHRPLVEYAPGLREADIALTEIANGKLTFESTLGQGGTAEPPARVVLFPGVQLPRRASDLIIPRLRREGDSSFIRLPFLDHCGRRSRPHASDCTILLLAIIAASRGWGKLQEGPE